MFLVAIHSTPFILKFVSIALGIVMIGFLLRLFRQTHVIVYIITGVALGPYTTGWVSDTKLIGSLGALGLVLLLFFIGMEISLQKLVANWKVSVLGTLFQIILTVAGVWAVGWYFDWPLAWVVTFGFVASLSSTAVIVKLLQDNEEIDQPTGQNVLGILLMQDILIVPMIITLGYISGESASISEIVLQIVGGVLIMGFVAFLVVKKEVKMPFDRLLKKDHEIQVFFAFGLCFGFSAITGFFGLSTALGAFVAGLLVAASKSTQWFHDSLYSLKIIFVALFFISVGMQIDIVFLWDNLPLIASLVILVFVGKNLVNTFTIRAFKMTWADSLYGGALLSQIGEFSFALGSLAYFNAVISDYAYQMIVSIISLTLLLSPFWVGLSHRIAARVSPHLYPRNPS